MPILVDNDDVRIWPGHWNGEPPPEHVQVMITPAGKMALEHAAHTRRLHEQLDALRLELHHALRRERAAVRLRDIYRSRLEELDGTSCRACGCTENNACPGGCSWAEEDLCSKCSEERQRRRLRRFLGLRRVYSRTSFSGPQIGWQEA